MAKVKFVVALTLIANIICIDKSAEEAASMKKLLLASQTELDDLSNDLANMTIERDALKRTLGDSEKVRVV